MAEEKPSVYIETTVVSYLTARLSRDIVRAADQIVTRDWWHKRKGELDFCTSQFVLDEAALGDAEAAQERLQALEGIRILNISGSGPLAESLILSAALPAKAKMDAYHLATAAMNGVEYFCTWNCRHLANAMMRKKIEHACRGLGIEPPIICTPSELLEEPL